MTHPDPIDLLDLALGAPVPTAADLARHVSQCPECAAEVARLKELGANLRSCRVESPGPDCLDLHLLAMLAEGRLPPDARAVALGHLAECGACSAAVASLTRALADPMVAREAAAQERWRSGRFLRFALPAAAAALLVVSAWPRGERDSGSSHRGPTITAAPAPVPIAPAGVVAGPSALRWSSVPGADQYRVTLFEADGSTRYEAQLTDTTLSIPDSVRLVSGHQYLWKVEARVGWDRWVSSELIEFSVGEGSSQ